VGLGGNIGKSFARQVAEEQHDVYVLELSSFQLDDMFSVRLDVAVLTNITPDHLDRYNYELKNYMGSKMRITQNQTEADYFIYCADDPITKTHWIWLNGKPKRFRSPLKKNYTTALGPKTKKSSGK